MEFSAVLRSAVGSFGRSIGHWIDCRCLSFGHSVGRLVFSLGRSFRSVGSFCSVGRSLGDSVGQSFRSVFSFGRSFAQSVGRSFRSVGPFRSGGHSVLRSVIGSDGI